MAAVTESSAAIGMEHRDWLKVSLATISRNHEWPDNCCDANTWQVISSSLDIDFIHGDIRGRSCKKYICIYIYIHIYIYIYTDSYIPILRTADMVSAVMIKYIDNIIYRICFINFVLRCSDYGSITLIQITDLYPNKLRHGNTNTIGRVNNMFRVSMQLISI